MSRIKPLFNDSLFISLLTAQISIFVLLKSPESRMVTLWSKVWVWQPLHFSILGHTNCVLVSVRGHLYYYPNTSHSPWWLLNLAKPLKTHSSLCTRSRDYWPVSRQWNCQRAVLLNILHCRKCNAKKNQPTKTCKTWLYITKHNYFAIA